MHDGNQEEDVVDMQDAQSDAAGVEESTNKEEELYRQQALDYARGHVASSVREDVVPDMHHREDGTSLFNTLLKAAGARADAKPIRPDAVGDTGSDDDQNGAMVIDQIDAVGTNIVVAKARPKHDGPSDSEEDEETTFRSEFPST